MSEFVVCCEKMKRALQYCVGLVVRMPGLVRLLHQVRLACQLRVVDGRGDLIRHDWG